MIECIDIVDGYVERGGATWTEDGMVVDAVAKRIEEIGEVAKRIAPETLASMPEVNWRGLKGIREVIAHDYDEIEPEILADVVRDKLPAVREAVDRVLRSG